MHSEATYKLLEHLYQIVPARESQFAISQEVFSDGDRTSVDGILNELMKEGYIYQWKNYADDNSSSSGQDEFGMTPKGIVFYDKYEDDKNAPVNTINSGAAPPDKMVPQAPIKTEAYEDKEQAFSFSRAIPVIILIIFAIGLVWFITHIKKGT